MRSKLLIILCALALMIGLLGMTASAEADVLILQEDTDSITVTQDTYLNLNGFDVGSVTVSSGMLYVFDGQTDDFSVADGNYGKITSINGNYAAAEGYVMVNEDGYSFHKVEMKLTDMSLRSETVGLYCKSEFAGDEVVARNVKTYGVALSIKGAPNAENLDETCERSTFDGFTNGKATSTMLNGILKTGNAYLTNKVNADTPVYASAYIEMNDGSFVFGQCQSRSLKQQVQGANGMWALLTDAQKSAMKEMFGKFTSIMGKWDLTGISLGEYADVVADPYTWYEEFMNLPIANNDMTVRERRQLALDYFRLQLSYVWTPNIDFTFYYGSNNGEVSLNVGTAYTGMVYAESNSCWVGDVEYTGNGGGNLYKMLKYYDPATGVMDLKAMGDPEVIFNTIGSHCNWGLSSGYSRVSDNIAHMGTIDSYRPSNTNAYIIVGGYVVGEETNNDAGLMDTEAIIENNATYTEILGYKFNYDYETIYRSYAAMDIADGLFSSTAHHVMMCSVKPVVVESNGKIDPDASYLYVIDQNAYGSRKTVAELETTQENGKTLWYLGGFNPNGNGDGTIGTKMTFTDLLEQEYIPFTIPEFVEDHEGYEIPEPEAWIGAADKESQYVWDNDKHVTLHQLIYGLKDNGTEKLHSNYVVSDVRVEVKDPATGKVIYSAEPNFYSRITTVYCNVALDKIIDEETYAPYADKGYKIHFYLHLSTGEWIEAFYTDLVTE